MISRSLLIILTTVSIICACTSKITVDEPIKENWSKRQTIVPDTLKYIVGKTYLPVYSHIYHRYEHQTFNLTITVSIRNVSDSDTLFLTSADYFNTKGKKVRQYLNFPVYLAPMETIEIVIEEDDIEGGSGANFIFNWLATNEKTIPFFEAIMVSTSGQQGLSFTTRGVRID